MIIYNYCDAQILLRRAFPKMKTVISVPDSVYSIIDSVKIKITITNNTDTSQHVLFNKPFKNYSWQTCGYVFDSKHKRVDDINCSYLASSAAYTGEDVKPYEIHLLPGSSISDVYYLNRIISFASSKPLKSGRYFIYISYFGNKSNTVSFALR